MIGRWFVASLLAVFAAQSVLAESQGPLPVFILVGQSNMQGHAKLRTFEHIGMDPKTAPILKKMVQADGGPVVCDEVWISSLSSNGERTGQLTAGFGADESKIGPEFTFGIFAHEMLDRPILIIKTAWGGKSLHTDFRPPSAGPYEFNENEIDRLNKQSKNVEVLQAERAEKSGVYYGLMLDHVRKVLADIPRVYPDYDAEQGYELAGLVWFQGWNDMVDSGVYPQRGKKGGYDRYSELFAQFIRDVRCDLDAPELPIVIGVMGAGGPVSLYRTEQLRYAGIHQNFRDAMAAPAALPEFQDNVKAVLTEQYWDQELVDLRARDAEVKRELKQAQADRELTRPQVDALREELTSKAFSEKERKALETGVSNFEFHYLGSAKILSQIGKGLAEASVSLMPSKEPAE